MACGLLFQNLTDKTSPRAVIYLRIRVLAAETDTVIFPRMYPASATNFWIRIFSRYAQPMRFKCVRMRERWAPAYRKSASSAYFCFGMLLLLRSVLLLGITTSVVREYETRRDDCAYSAQEQRSGIVWTPVAQRKQGEATVSRRWEARTSIS